MQFIQILFVILIVALIPLVLYALTKCGRDFDFLSWILYTRTRLFLGFVFILLVSLLVAFVPEANAILAAIGFDTAKSNAALGLAIGGMLVSLIRGDDEKV